MEPLTTASIAVALGAGVRSLAEQTTQKAFLDPILDPIAQRMRSALPIFKDADGAALHKSVTDALSDLDVNIGDEDAISQWLANSGLAQLSAPKNDTLRRQMARAILTYTDPTREPPEALVTVLGWPRSQQSELARTLGVLRTHVSAVEGWRPLIEYADRAAERGELNQIHKCLTRLEQVITETEAGHALRVALIDRALSQAEAQELEVGYREDLIRDLRFHNFQGIVQIKQDVRLPLADIYQELGLLNLADDKKRREAQERILTLRQEERMVEEERHLDERVTDALSRNQRLMILGEPGSGKTISLRFIALMLAHGVGSARLGLEAPHIPIQVRMADYARTLEKTPSLSLDNYLLQELRNRFTTRRLDEFLELALHNGACMVLLDGLDEVGDDPIQGLPLRTQVVRQVQTFGDRWCNREQDERRTNRLIVTSRIEGYWNAQLRDCAHVQLSPLRPPDEVEAFLLRWFTAHEAAHDGTLTSERAAEKAGTKVAKLLPGIVQTPSVRRLATNPLLLTILALIHENVGRLPNRRIKLYAICAQTLIESWRQAQTGHLSTDLLADLGEETVLRIMAPLAFWLHTERPGGTAPIDEWQTQLRCILAEEGFEDEAEHIAWRFLNHARFSAGLLAERGLNEFGFFHLTFEEYLAACHIAHQRVEKRKELIGRTWEDPRWHEVLSLAAGRLGNINDPYTADFLEDLVKMEASDPAREGRQVVLAGRALADIGTHGINRKTRRWIQEELRATMQDWDLEAERAHQPPQITVRIRYEAGEVLDELGWLPPDIDAWICCPQCGDNGEDLLVAKYPLTNAQFAHFVAGNGYANPDLWSREGWRWRIKEAVNHKYTPRSVPVVEPWFWRDNRFGRERSGYPLVGISWYEAAAYAGWLTHLLEQVKRGTVAPESTEGQPVAELAGAGAALVRLPSAEEWERAAGGGHKERYPWDAPAGDVTQDVAGVVARANVSEAKLYGTSPVAMYPLSSSQPWGLSDMAGNVWEWTGSWYDGQRSGRVLRGGSWLFDYGSAPAAVRYYGIPVNSLNDVGVRLCAPIGSQC